MKKSCNSCAYSRSTCGVSPRLYCYLKTPNVPLPKKACPCWKGVFVDVFSIPSKFLKGGSK